MINGPKTAASLPEVYVSPPGYSTGSQEPVTPIKGSSVGPSSQRFTPNVEAQRADAEIGVLYQQQR